MLIPNYRYIKIQKIHMIDTLCILLIYFMILYDILYDIPEVDFFK